MSSSAFALRATADNLRKKVGLPTVARSRLLRAEVGADDRNRTGDLVLTKDALCQLSYIGLCASRCGRYVGRNNSCHPPADKARPRRRLERETGIEPATNSLEGCDSTTELLPPTRCSLRLALRPVNPPARFKP